jgi:hypothetical protein
LRTFHEATEIETISDNDSRVSDDCEGAKLARLYSALLFRNLVGRDTYDHRWQQRVQKKVEKIEILLPQSAAAIHFERSSAVFVTDDVQEAAESFSRLTTLPKSLHTNERKSPEAKESWEFRNKTSFPYSELRRATKRLIKSIASSFLAVVFSVRRDEAWSWQKIHKLSSVKNSKMSFTLAHIPLLRNGGKEKKKKSFQSAKQNFLSLFALSNATGMSNFELSFAYFSEHS